MSRFLTSVIVGAASGAAAAYFLTTEKGQDVRHYLDTVFADVKEDPKAFLESSSRSVSDKITNLKERYEASEFPKEDVLDFLREKGQGVFDKAINLSDQPQFSQDHVTEEDLSDDIIIEYYPDNHDSEDK